MLTGITPYDPYCCTQLEKMGLELRSDLYCHLDCTPVLFAAKPQNLYRSEQS